jgi:hypothetical protein
MTFELIFEETTSPLYRSNDGRLRISTDTDRRKPVEHVLQFDGVEVFRTRDRVMVDAYIAGYDLAEGSRR